MPSEKRGNRFENRFNGKKHQNKAKMTQDDSFIEVHITFPTEQLACDVGTFLVEEHLAACAQVSGPMKSIYYWNGNLESETEFLLVLKTISSRMKKIIICVRERHPYSCPQITAIPILSGTDDYLNWISESVCTQ
ncbi:MAG: divalent-cation tolerance protein CutA [Thermoguttaceae bacterium]